MVYGEREGLETERMGRREGYAGDSCWGEGGDVAFKGFGGEDFVYGGHVCFGSYLVSWLGILWKNLRISAIRAKIARLDN